ncbi:F/Y-rich N-terminus-domain-containing protein [Cladochytrium replicatum]|nr:F/Y-rich N-terminus-domain-containing protein [Cladochytrium replicatum]
MADTDNHNYLVLKQKLLTLNSENARITADLKAATTKMLALKREKDLLLDRICRYDPNYSSDRDSLSLSEPESIEDDDSSDVDLDPKAVLARPRPPAIRLHHPSANSGREHHFPPPAHSRHSVSDNGIVNNHYQHHPHYHPQHIHLHHGPYPTPVHPQYSQNTQYPIPNQHNINPQFLNHNQYLHSSSPVLSQRRPSPPPSNGPNPVSIQPAIAPHPHPHHSNTPPVIDSRAAHQQKPPEARPSIVNRQTDSRPPNLTSEPQHRSSSTSPHPPASSTPTATPAQEDSKKSGKKSRRNPQVVQTKPKRAQQVPYDPVTGAVVLPLQIGVTTLIALGTVVYDRDSFHTERYIFPVGYTAIRKYNSMIDPGKMVKYTCTILDAGDGPRFQITPDDAPDKPIVASSATGAWTVVIKAANTVRNRDHSNSASGPDYFGFAAPTISMLIQNLPNAEKCRNYVRQTVCPPKIGYNRD